MARHSKEGNWLCLECGYQLPYEAEECPRCGATKRVYREPVKDTDIKPRPRRTTIRNFLEFRSFITVPMVTIGYTFGMVVMSLSGLIVLLEDLRRGLAILVIGNLIWRLMCEGVILFSSLHQHVVGVRNELERLNAEVEAISRRQSDSTAA